MNDPSAAREVRTVYYIRDGELRDIAIHSDKGLVRAKAIDSPQEANAPEKADGGVEAAVMASLSKAYNECSAELKRLVEEEDGSDESPLYRLFVEMQAASGDAQKTDLRYVRQTRNLTNGEWLTPSIRNMSDAEDKSKYHHEVVAHYERLAPEVSGVRVLVLENAFFSVELQLFVMQRAFAFFSLYDATNSTQQVSASERLAMTPKSIVFSHIAYGLTGFDDKATATDDAECVEKRRLKLAALDDAHTRYTNKRREQRDRLLAANMPMISEFVILLFGLSLLKTIDAAKPHTPERVIIRLPVERAGSVIDLDSVVSATESDMHQTLSEFVRVAQESTVALKALLAGENKDLAAIQAARQKYEHDNLAATRARQLVDAMATVHGDRQVLLHVFEKGYGQDAGSDIDVLFALTIPYALLRKKNELIKAELAKEEQKAEEAAEAAPAPPAEPI